MARLEVLHDLLYSPEREDVFLLGLPGSQDVLRNLGPKDSQALLCLKSRNSSEFN